MTKESSVELELLYTTVLQIYRTLETLQQPVETWDAIFVYSTAYEKSRGIKFQFKSQPATAKTYYQGQSNDNSGSNKNVCPICKGKHYVMKCPKYVDETLAQKLALVTKHKLCFNCLGNHRVSHCKVVKRCQKCGKKHHTTIHKVEASSEKKDVKSEDQVQSSSAVMDTNAAKVLHSIVDSNVPASCVLLATARLTSSIPSLAYDKDAWLHLKNLNLADPSFNKPGSIDLIIGIDLYTQIIEEGIVKGEPNTPIAQLTKLGWIVSGLASLNQIRSHAQGYHVSVNDDLHDLLKRFWETEEVSLSTQTLSKDEQDCEDHFKATHSRDAVGRYIVKLPFKDSPDKLGDSKAKAIRQMVNMSNKFSNNKSHGKLYTDFIEEYEKLNHMKRVDKNLIEPNRVYYMPHHGVYREQSLSTKLRVVFNGSSKTTTGYSLNQILHAGAKLQINLFNVLIWFRVFRYVFFADIEKMYRQIRVHPDDWDFQRIVWIDFLALRAFEQLILDEGHRFPLAMPTMKKGRYIDDFFGGEDTIEKTQLVIEQLNGSNSCASYKKHQALRFQDGLDQTKLTHLKFMDFAMHLSTQSLLLFILGLVLMSQ
ncbi:uncharacterized protein [Temnothorax longispinosus]|uniref:uncharacterized protein n=1 Tax=Temnothorax longispinosus TaxID=300112 RepID=UPI003A98F2AA